MDKTRCVCPICNGSQKLQWKEGQPKAFPHEIGAYVAGPVFERRETPKEAPEKPPAEMEAYIEWVLGRTDLNEGMRRMLISNRRRKG